MMFPQNPQELIARAREGLGQGVLYGLGCGGYRPDKNLGTPKCWRKPKGKILPIYAPFLDCSGYVAWCLGRSRKPSEAFPFWLSTDSIVGDARGRKRLFRPIPAPIPGCLAVYGDSKDSKGVAHQGHVGIVIDPAKQMVLDCSSGNGFLSMYKRCSSMVSTQHYS